MMTSTDHRRHRDPALHDGLWVAARWTDPASLGFARATGGGQKYATWTVRDGKVTYESGAPRDYPRPQTQEWARAIFEDQPARRPTI